MAEDRCPLKATIYASELGRRLDVPCSLPHGHKGRCMHGPTEAASWRKAYEEILSADEADQNIKDAGGF